MDQSGNTNPFGMGIPQAGGQMPHGNTSSGSAGQSTPAGGSQPAASGAQPATGAPPVGGQAGAVAPAAEESFLRPRPPDSTLGIGSVGDFSTSVAVPAHPNTKFDEVYFLKMLSGSISLTKNEKKKIVEAISKLSQYQIDELIKIFEEERRKFAELDERHQVKIRELQQKQTEDWRDLEMEKQQVAQKGEDTAAADALRAKLMGGGAKDAEPVKSSEIFSGAASASPLGAKPATKKCSKCQAEQKDPKAVNCEKCGAGI